MGFPTSGQNPVIWGHFVSIPGRDLWVFRRFCAIDSLLPATFQSLVGIYGFSDLRGYRRLSRSTCFNPW